MENKEIIFNLVKNHFSFSEEGLGKFKNYLFNPFIDDTYKEIVKDGLRAYFPVESFDTSRLDEGWQLYKNYFATFIRNHGVTYDNFFNNKIIINKNERKLIKFMEEYFTKKLAQREAQAELGFYGYGRDTDEVVRSKVLQDFTTKMNNVGAKKLSKGKIQVVFSMDFADWFLCSTGEKWTSCISLDSDYDGNYWAGLPGLVGDKNRAMIYVTDGVKKTYAGITVDRLLARSWVLLNKKDKMQIVHFYPNSLISPDDVGKIIGQKFNYGNELDRGFQSKYPIDVIKFENGNSAGVFQDSYGLCEDGYIRYGNHGYNHFDPHGRITESRIFTWRGGLQGLIQKNAKLGGHEDERLKCCICGAYLDEDDALYANDDGPYCDRCFNDRYFSCADCGDSYPNEEIHEAFGNCYCRECFNTHFTMCSCCGEQPVRNDYAGNFTNPEGKAVCEDCYYKNFALCSFCNKPIGDKNKKVKTKTGVVYCLPCAVAKGVTLHRHHG